MKKLDFDAGEACLSSKTALAKFKEFRENDNFCDVNLFSGGTLVKAHRVVLAASCPYFEAMFNAGLKESKEMFINLPAIHPDVLPLLVNFIYTGRATISESTAQELMVAAHMLHIEDLVIGCTRYLKSQLDTSNVLNIFRFAENLNYSELADSALVYAGKHWATIAHGEDLLDLPLPVFIRILSSSNFVVKNELDVVLSVVHWLKHDPMVRASNWDEFIPLLRLGCVPTDVLNGVWKNLEDPQLAKIFHAMITMMIAVTNTCPRGPSAFYFVGGSQVVNYQHRTGVYQEGVPVPTVFKFDLYKEVWATMAPMATPRRRPGVAALGGRIYAVGGDNGKPLATGEVYDPATNEWSPIDAMNTARKKFGLAALRSKLYAFAGEGAEGVLSSIEVYDPVTDKWTSVGNTPDARCGMSVVTYNGAVYMTGGTSTEGTLSSVLRYEAKTASCGVWFSCASMGQARCNHAAAVVDDRLYVVGGCNANKISCYDFTKDRWENVAQVSEILDNCTAGGADGKLLVAGSSSSNAIRFKLFEVNENCWTDCPSVSHLCINAGSAVL